jgi:hypothetical protein
MARFHGTLLTTWIYIKHKAIEAVDFLIFDPGRWEHRHFADEALNEATQDLLASADDRDALLTSRWRRLMQ